VIPSRYRVAWCQSPIGWSVAIQCRGRAPYRTLNLLDGVRSYAVSYRPTRRLSILRPVRCADLQSMRPRSPIVYFGQRRHVLLLDDCTRLRQTRLPPFHRRARPAGKLTAPLPPCVPHATLSALLPAAGGGEEGGSVLCCGFRWSRPVMNPVGQAHRCPVLPRRPGSWAAGGLLKKRQSFLHRCLTRGRGAQHDLAARALRAHPPFWATWGGAGRMTRLSDVIRSVRGGVGAACRWANWIMGPFISTSSEVVEGAEALL